jgi:hypothetical protein
MKKLVIAGIIIATWIMICLLANAAELPAIPLIPKKFKKIKIVKPDPAVPKEVADFSGEWEGVWKYVGPIGQFTYLSFRQETRRAKLIVYEVSSDKIKGLYGWGESPFGRGKAGWGLFESDLMDDNGKKRFSFIGGGRMGFYLEDGIIKGTSGGYYDTEMKRVK